MSVDFTASVIYGFHISREEFNDLMNRIGEDEAWEIYDGYMMTADGYDEDSDLFFVVQHNMSTAKWEELNIHYDSEKGEDYIKAFHKYFPDRKDGEPKLYLIQEVW